MLLVGGGMLNGAAKAGCNRGLCNGGVCTKEVVQSLVQSGGLWGGQCFWGRSSKKGGVGHRKGKGEQEGEVGVGEEEEVEGDVAEVCRTGWCVGTVRGGVMGCTRVCREKGGVGV